MQDPLQKVRDILDRWECGVISHWTACVEIRKVVGGDSNEMRTRLYGNRK